MPRMEFDFPPDEAVALVKGQLFVVQSLPDSDWGMFINLYDLAHGDLTNTNSISQFFTGISR